MVGLECFHIEEERSAVVPVAKSFGLLWLVNEMKIGTGFVRGILRCQRHFCLITDDFVNQNEALLRVDGRLASKPPCGVLWVTLTCLLTVVLMVEHTITFIEHRGRGRTQVLVVKVTVERIR